MSIVGAVHPHALVLLGVAAVLLYPLSKEIGGTIADVRAGRYGAGKSLMWRLVRPSLWDLGVAFTFSAGLYVMPSDGEGVLVFRPQEYQWAVLLVWALIGVVVLLFIVFIRVIVAVLVRSQLRVENVDGRRETPDGLDNEGGT
jgi:hypothetical protein